GGTGHDDDFALQGTTHGSSLRCEFGYELTNLIDANANPVARREVPTPSRTAAGRRTRGDHVSRQQCQARAEMRNLFRHGKNEIGARGVLHQLVVDPELNAEIAMVRDLIHRTYPRPDGQRAIEALLTHPVESEWRADRDPLPAQMISSRQVVDDRKPRDIPERIIDANVSARPADHEGDLRLPVDHPRMRRQRDAAVWPAHALRRSLEKMPRFESELVRIRLDGQRQRV